VEGSQRIFKQWFYSFSIMQLSLSTWLKF